MVTAGYKDIMNVDISNLVINHMAERYKGNTSLQCTSLTNPWSDHFLGRTMNVLALEFTDGSFDGIVDKGTMDAVLVSNHEI